MRAILEYNLPEETDAFDLAYNGARVAIVIEDLDNYLRSKLKYETLTDEQEACYQAIRDKLNELKYE